MTVKDHYDKHLAGFYSWYTGDFEKNKDHFKTFCIENSIKPSKTGFALDLGAGSGIQSIALAELGFKVKAIDFNKQLLEELKTRINDYPVETIYEDIRNIKKYINCRPELIICCGDTIPHLESKVEIKKLIEDLTKILLGNGKLVLSFRNYSNELTDTSRFIPVKSEDKRILTCFLEYFDEKIRVTDLLHESENGKWVQKISSYYKTRVLKNEVIQYMEESNLQVNQDIERNGIISLIGQKIY